MSKKTSNEKRLNRIIDEHNTLVNMVKDSLEEKTDALKEVDNNVLNILDFDSENVKRYEAVVKAQEMVSNLLNEAMNAKDSEEVIKLRKKINYYISKIKKEMKNRNISDEELAKYQNSVGTIRKDVAKYVRFLKRDSRIEEMSKLNENYDSLTAEERTHLQKLLKNERSYNTRNLKVAKEVVEDTVELTPIIKPPKIILDDEEFSNDQEFLANRIEKIELEYGIVRLYDYDNHLGKNVLKLVGNMTKYMKNKRIIHYMDFNTRFHAPAELLGYIEYAKRRNSFIHGLKSTFSKSYLKSDETKYLNNHDECVKWLLEYCQEESLPICYTKKMA